MPPVRFVGLHEDTYRRLRSQPESGMGFQIVEEQPLIGGERTWLVFGGRRALELVDSLDVARWLTTRAAHEYSLAAYFRGERLDAVTLRQAEVVMRRTEIARGPYLHGVPEGAVPARSALVKSRTTKQNEVFYRLSANKADWRVEADGSFIRGTYATTATDAPFAPSGFAAVGRYALPNDQPASYRHAIGPLEGTLVDIGTVAPAYGQAGGGVEVYFPYGAKNVRAYEAPTTLPDE